MSLQNRKRKLLSPILGALLAFLIVAVPHMARADVCDISSSSSSDGLGTDTGGNSAGSGSFYQDYSNSLHNEMMKKNQAKQDVWKNSPTLDIKLHYCHALITQAIHDLSQLANPKGLIMDIIFNNIISAFLNGLCQQMLAILNDVTQALKVSVFNFICLPLPKLHLGLHLPQFKSCPGLPLIQLKTTLQSNAPQTPNQWNIWNNQKYQNYTPPGP